MVSKEAILHQQVVDYLKLQYPDVIFRTDFASGIKMTMGQAVKHKRLQKSRAYPDLFIAEPRQGRSGLFIELKAVTPYKATGELKTDKHLQEQDEMLKTLRNKGYRAGFAVGFDQAKSIIDNYLVK